MTKSTITRERLEQLADKNTICKVSWDERIELAQIALAAMDSEPVAEVVSIYGDPEAFGEREIRPLVGIQQMPYGTKLYRHAQPASVVPVVPDFKKLARELVDNLVDCGGLDEGLKEKYLEWAEKTCRATMLQAGNAPVNGVTAGKPLTIILPDISSKAFWSGSGKTEVFHPETYRRWVKEAIKRGCIIACIDAEVK
ncbi:hypothetical protein VBR27_20415 [Klebsiella pneumoniae]|uniref:hypothetical protein n=1 Tax=Klebsiella pneumoniae TaxID=573 RepID=UPI000E2D84F1|nr:hypothetical protein [Klebsiella pneumoniae]MEA4235484.1 hypothetical protein [Klebsiella pneumoniae]MEA4445436.1 hypothetical protein [Klebsiella pneumoniae]MEA4515016.1 hypothetical protein [Klebsiella pneumoniae]MEA4691343.1 hypothetical protein [Klebsiella pneumoniae]MEA4722865.1 hypothetical protein [Klebsiella pneumoniae]